MNAAELKAKWVEELRSGRIEQTRGALIRGDAMCCLGVLCNMMGTRPEEGSNLFPGWWLNERPISGGVQYKLISMNDGKDQNAKSFREIADWIETHDLQTGEPLGRD